MGGGFAATTAHLLTRSPVYALVDAPPETYGKLEHVGDSAPLLFVFLVAGSFLFLV